MSGEITRYVVCEDPDEWGDGPTYEQAKYEDAKREASSIGGCVVEITYEFSDSELVDDFRASGEAE